MEEIIWIIMVITFAILCNIYWYKKINRKTAIVYGIYELVIITLFLFLIF